MISCKSVATLLSSDQLQKAGFLKRCEVKIHLLMCTYCARFAQQLRELCTTARTMSASQEPDKNLEARLLRKLSEK